MDEHAASLPPRFDAVLVGTARPDAHDAVRLAGGRVAAAFGWGEEIRMAGKVVLVIEADEADERSVADALPEVARLAVARGLKVVATSDLRTLDMVEATLHGTGAELLCEPGLPDRVAALLSAVDAAEAPAAAVREDPAPPYDAGPAADAPGAADAEELRRAIRARRMRDEFFMPGLFADPAWDMLLDLYAAEGEGHPVSVSSLCIAAAVAPTTALRWIQRMQEDGLLERRPDETDRRRAFMALTEVARLGMREYIDAVRKAGLGIA